ncbi:hypothetical protein NE237_010164 [Protea cynaroides]|uniref:Uncharacterized protein n=1 Tax=Protea cynaroides TaxID=273540 RepID=A0A9Q0KZ89_9MAGN|nr:hypothetical protein NE237_010164 [Protea cynaroides]
MLRIASDNNITWDPAIYLLMKNLAQGHGSLLLLHIQMPLIEESKNEFPAETLRIQQQLLDDEIRPLQVELASLLDGVQETETKMVEMSALNHLIATHVLQQTKQIRSVEATKNVEMGNKELSQAIQRHSSGGTFLLLFLFVLSFSIMFLDWYS